MPSALVTGSAKGIGKALLLMLAEQGYDVVVHYRSSREEAEVVGEAARAFGVRAVTLQADVSRPDEAVQLVHNAYDAWGGLDVVINNVGNYYKVSLSELPFDTWHHMFDTNLHSTFYTCQTAVPLMRDKGGRIINLGFAGSEHLVARPGIVAYGIAKTGVILYSKSLAKTEAKHGITVNVISPGIMANSESQPVDSIPMGRLGELDELTAVACFLLSPEAAYVTGTHIEVAGGWNV
jgi:NAD(P)-dependent dehydrogenase (short-subunit alcohol dehydrogenase family)